MTTLAKINSITFDHVIDAVRLDDLDQAVLSLQCIAGIDDGGVADIAFSQYDTPWSDMDEGERVSAIAGWLDMERMYAEMSWSKPDESI
jgi:hypothetical protein